MLPRIVSLPLALLVASSVSCLALGCGAPALDDVDGQGAAVTGSDETEKNSPLVYVFDDKDSAAGPVCMGAKIGDKHVLTVKGCGSDSSVVRQASADGATKPIAISKVLTPTGSSTADTSDLRVLELASKIEGPDVKLGALTLKDGYTVLGANTLDPKDKNAVEVEGRIESQTGAVGKLVLTERDQQLCATDLGAPVFAKKPKRAWYTAWLFKTGDWVLSGMVSGRSAATDTAATPSDTSKTDPSTATTTSIDKGCANGPWSAAAVAAQAGWLAKFAPPKPTPKPPNAGSPATKAELQSCSIVTQTLAEVKSGARTAVLEATATYTNLRAGEARAQIGIAPKAAPTKMTWTPATVAETTGARADVRIQGGLDAPTTEGDYVVLFRASADGGLTWTDCDLDGSQNGASQTLALRVSAAAPATTTPAPAADYNPSSDPSDSDSDSTTSRDDESGPTEEAASKPAAGGGCSVSQPTSGAPSRGLGGAVLLLGLAAVVRRRKAR